MNRRSFLGRTLATLAGLFGLAFLAPAKAPHADPTLPLAGESGKFARLVGRAENGEYQWREVWPIKDGWTDGKNLYGGAYHLNGFDVPQGCIVIMWPTKIGEWRFQG